MSIKVTSYVWENSKAKGSALLLLLAIADHAHDDGKGAYPSIDTLTKKCRQSERNTQRLLRALEKAGEIIILDQASPYGTNVYQVPMGGDKLARVTSTVLEGDIQGTVGVTNRVEIVPQMSPEPSFKTSIQPSVEPPAPNDFQKVWTEVEQCFVVMNPSDFQKLRDLWEQYPDFQRHNYAITQARKTNPKQFRFYLKDYASFNPTIPRTWGNAMMPSEVLNGAGTIVSAAPMHPMALRSMAVGAELVGQTLERLLQQGKIKEDMYHASCKKFATEIQTPTNALPLPTG